MTTMTKEVWFVTGSQHLYGPKVLETVAKDSEAIVAGLNSEANLPVNLVCKPTVKSPEEIHAVCQAANTDPNCVGLVLWMHTFSPAKMWISCGPAVLSSTASMAFCIVANAKLG